MLLHFGLLLEVWSGTRTRRGAYGFQDTVQCVVARTVRKLRAARVISGGVRIICGRHLISTGMKIESATTIVVPGTRVVIAR